LELVAGLSSQLSNSPLDCSPKFAQQDVARQIWRYDQRFPKFVIGLERRQILTVRQFFLLSLSRTASVRKRTVSSPLIISIKISKQKKSACLFLELMRGLSSQLSNSPLDCSPDFLRAALFEIGVRFKSPDIIYKNKQAEKICLLIFGADEGT
jgi:hypothetical protein